MERRTAKDRLFISLFLVILLPLLQHMLNVVESGKLDGAMVAHTNTEFTPATWWDGSYQEKKTSYINDSVGFRPDLVRMTNQLNYWVFNTLPADIYVGGNNYLFMKEYVDEYVGRCYLGDKEIRAALIKLKAVQDTFQKIGKTFIFIYAPGKPYFMPENIPLKLQRSGGPKTSNYTAFRRLSDSINIRQIDYNALFKAMKDTSKNPLFTRLGIHWSLYGSLLASDTLIKFIERERNIKMPHLVITNLRHPDTMKFPDNDLAKCSNLIFPLKVGNVCYPEYYYDTTGTKTKPKMVFIGDSFGGQWLGNEFIQNVTETWQYWFYFNFVWDKNNIFNDAVKVNAYDWRKQMLDADCIISVWNPFNLQGQTIPSAFIEQMYTYFYPDKK